MTIILTVVVGLPDGVNDGSVRTGSGCCCSAGFLLLISTGYIIVFIFLSSVQNCDSSIRNKLTIETLAFVVQASKVVEVGGISLLLLLSLLGTILLPLPPLLLLWELDNDDLISSSAGIIVLLLTRTTEEDELLLLLFGDDGDVGDATDESSVAARAEGNKRFRKIPRKIEMAELGHCGAGMPFNADMVGMDCCVMVVDGTVRNLVWVETLLGGRFDDNMLEKMVVDGTVKNLV